jgi:hypothetical protein
LANQCGGNRQKIPAGHGQNDAQANSGAIRDPTTKATFNLWCADRWVKKAASAKSVRSSLVIKHRVSFQYIETVVVRKINYSPNRMPV